MSQANESRKMGEMPVTKLVFNMSLPIIISMMVQALYNVVDSIFVGQFNTHALEAVSLAFPVQNLMISLAVGLGVGTNALVARHLGEKRRDRAGDVASAGIGLSIVGYIAFAIIAIFIIKPFFSMQTGIPEVAAYGQEYLSVAMFFGIGIFLEVMGERLLQSTGHTKLSMISQATGAGINIILDPIFIFGHFGLPAMGAQGAAIATVIGQIVAGVLAIILNVKFNKDIQLKIKRIVRPIGEDVAQIFKIGLPSMILNAIMSIVVFIMNLILRGFSEDAITAYGIFFKLISFVYMPIFGLNSGLVPIFSYNYGSRQIDRIHKAYRVGIISALIFMGICTVVFEIFAIPLLQLFSATENVTAIGLVALRIMAIGFPMAGVEIINSTIFQSAGNPFNSLLVTIIRQGAALLPCAFLLAQTGNVNNVWWAIPIAEATGLILSLIFYRKLRTKLNALSQEKEVEGPV